MKKVEFDGQSQSCVPPFWENLRDQRAPVNAKLGSPLALVVIDSQRAAGLG